MLQERLAVLGCDPVAAAAVGVAPAADPQRSFLGELDGVDVNPQRHPHRLAIAGYRDNLFTEEAQRNIYRFSGGFPRKINILCDNALFQGFLMRERVIEGSIVEEMAFDLGFEAQVHAQASIPAVEIPPPDWAQEGDEAEWEKSVVKGPEATPEEEKAASTAAGPDEVSPDLTDFQESPVEETEDDIDSKFDAFFEETFSGDE